MAAMRLNDPPADAQSHAKPMHFGCEERVEDTLGFVDRESDTRIAHRNHWPTIIASLRRHGQVTARVFHRLDAVQHEVNQYLLQLHTVSYRSGKRRIELRADRDGVAIR